MKSGQVGGKWASRNGLLKLHIHVGAATGEERDVITNESRAVATGDEQHQSVSLTNQSGKGEASSAGRLRLPAQGRRSTRRTWHEPSTNYQLIMGLESHHYFLSRIHPLTHSKVLPVSVEIYNLHFHLTYHHYRHRYQYDQNISF
eukprot:GHVU01215216.1.p2 GENE.GHVU01215216.1~~GHVU01215216.1.p2  ORF type:complete len:145 (-),score=4.88 GHVU01215216.1:1359-1793(-)